MDTLDYEPTAAARPVTVERGDGTTRVVVAMTGRYAPVPRWALMSGELALVVGLLYWAIVVVGRSVLRVPRPPRAVFQVGCDTVRVELRDRASGEVSNFEWPRSAVVEVRPNRYEPGLWLEVTGHAKDTFLSDLCRDDVARLAAELRRAFDGNG